MSAEKWLGHKFLCTDIHLSLYNGIPEILSRARYPLCYGFCVLLNNPCRDINQHQCCLRQAKQARKKKVLEYSKDCQFNEFLTPLDKTKSHLSINEKERKQDTLVLLYGKNFSRTETFAIFTIFAFFYESLCQVRK